MNKRAAISISIAILVLLGAGFGAYVLRGDVRDLAYQISRPTLPDAVPYVAPTNTAQAETAPPLTPPQDEEGKARGGGSALPAQINLSVPFLLQAPTQNWDQPFQDACEEASLIMVDAYYDGRKTKFGAEEGLAAILDVVAFEDQEYGYNKDTNAEEVMHTAQSFFVRDNVEIVEATEANIKSALAQGHPVIAPAHGKSLLNPNFRNGGPEYHMLVIKGYTKDGQWITNDPGTRNGADYLYPKQRLLDAIHDFNPEGMKLGRKVVIVIKP